MSTPDVSTPRRCRSGPAVTPRPVTPPGMKRRIPLSVVAIVAVAAALLVSLPNVLLSPSPPPAPSSSPPGPRATAQGFPLPPGHYFATFTETGLPNGTPWGLLFNGTLFQNGSTFSSNGTLVYAVSSRISFEVVNGTYPFRPFCLCGLQSYHVSTTAASPLRIDGTSVTIQAAFQLGSVLSCGSPNGCERQPPYPVSFVASGLLAGTLWGINFDNATVFANGTSLSYLMWNGTYRYAVEAPGWQPDPASGNVAVNGTGMNESITFTPVTYTVTLTESGLPTGTSWSVTLAGTSQISTTTSITFQESNGTYAFSVRSASGYTSTPSTGSFRVSGAPVSQALTFSPPSSGTSSGFLGLTGDAGYYLLGGVVTLAVAGVAVALTLRARRK